MDWSKVSDSSSLNGNTTSAQSGLLVKEMPEIMGPLINKTGVTSVFSSSLPVPLHETLNLGSHNQHSVDVKVPHIGSEAGAEALIDEVMVSQTIGDLLPDDEEELLAGIAEGVDILNLTNASEENEYFDLFSSVGGLEMDGDTQDSFGTYMDNSRDTVGFFGNDAAFHRQSYGPDSVIGEHSYGEHPSRTLFVRNIISNVEDSELRAMFEQYGAIRTLYTACKHRGFVMISYYDIRAARNAMRGLHNKPLRCRKLDIHFSIPKDNPSDKDVNQGTLVVFNLDASVSNDELCQIFGQYGEVKEIRETPHKCFHKFIEFYDVRAAEAALQALNRCDIAGKRIKLEPSRPVGTQRSVIQQLTQELEQEKTHPYRQQLSFPATHTPPGCVPAWGHYGSPVENGPSGAFHYSLGTLLPGINKPSPGFSVTLPHPSSVHAGTTGCHSGQASQINTRLSTVPTGHGATAIPAHYAHSLPKYSNGIMPFYSPPARVSIRGTMISHIPQSGAEGPHPTNGPGNAVGIPSSGPFSHLSSVPTGNTSISGCQLTWGRSSPYQPNTLPIMWSTPAMGHSFNPVEHAQHQTYGFAGAHGRPVNTCFPSHRHHIGSAPSGGPSVLERQHGYFAESPDSSFFGPGSLGSVGVPSNIGADMMNIKGAHSVINSGDLGTNGGFETVTSPSFGMMSPCHRMHMLQASGISIACTSDGLADRGRIRRSESSGTQADNKKQYQLDIDRILCGEDTRTTLMIKNIPNKYTSKMLLAAIDENHRGTYDFVYLPIDFKNKCNVGYAFINMISPAHIIPIYQVFNGKKWEKFNSEKVASLAYARIQGKAALVAHFQNSSLMNEDKRCRPILFDSRGPERSRQEACSRESISKDQSRIGDLLEIMPNSSNRDGSIPGSAGSSSGEMVSWSPEKE